MNVCLPKHSNQNALSEALLSHTGILTERCYQCGKCAAGCPLADEMDYPSTVIMRMLQLGLPEMDDKVLQSYTIWLCLTCETCYARCPMEIDIPRVMDYLRGESLRLRKVNRRAKDILAFNKSFLDFEIFDLIILWFHKFIPFKI